MIDLAKRRRAIALLLGLLLVALSFPSLAGAHASLTGSQPTSGATIDRAPPRVVFRFSEQVEGSFGAVRVVDERGRRVDDGHVSRVAGGSGLAVGLRGGIGRGAYTATYRVVSADGHPVSGGITFTIGRGVTATPLDVRSEAAGSSAPAGIGTALSIARAVRYLGIGGVCGLLVLLLVVWRPLRRAGRVPDPAAEPFARAAGRLLRGAALVGALGAVAALVLQTANAGGTGIGDALRSGPLGDVLGTRTGAWFALSAVAFALLAGAAGRLARATGGWLPIVGVALLALLVVAPAIGGHAAASSPSAVLIPVEIVHVAGMGSWVGGLLALLLVLPRATRALPAGSPRTALLAAVLMRFSPVALVSVAALTAAGTTLAIFQLTTLYDLTDTAYGRAILIKASLLTVAIGVAVVQRELLLPRLRRLAAGNEALAEGEQADAPATATAGGAEASAPVAAGPAAEALPAAGQAPASNAAATGRHVRTALRAELALLVAVLITTGALAGYAPPKAQTSGPASVTRDVGDLEVQLVVDPARRGPNALHLYVLDRRGQPLRRVAELRVRALPPNRGTPIDVPARVAGPGHWVAPAVPLATRGSWRISVELRRSAFDQQELELPVRVR
ncbi:copper resistance protein CopC [Patulibacter medicamentivorans]|uniref:Copper resistance protein CopC n=1 Tax=Patulibacter medicamentivorans TaxID=1097667 RepID=H0E8A2_9ACTN|nr:copper resistance protein CopC [Patulibacter medicamentivorans]EHN10103.1 copper resistance protein CopC [Patulibacter medicamentivorans]